MFQFKIKQILFFVILATLGTGCTIKSLPIKMDRDQISNFINQIQTDKIDSIEIFKSQFQNQLIEIEQTVDYGSLPPTDHNPTGYYGYTGNSTVLYLILIYKPDSKIECLYISYSTRVGADGEGNRVDEITGIGTIYYGRYSRKQLKAGKDKNTYEFDRAVKVVYKKKEKAWKLKNTWNAADESNITYNKMIFVEYDSLSNDSTISISKIIAPGGNKIGGPKPLVYDLQHLFNSPGINFKKETLK